MGFRAGRQNLSAARRIAGFSDGGQIDTHATALAEEERPHNQVKAMHEKTAGNIGRGCPGEAYGVPTASNVHYACDEGKYKKVVRFRCDTPAPVADGKPAVAKGVLGIVDCSHASIEDFEEDHAIKAVKKIDGLITDFCSALGPGGQPLAPDLSLKDHILKNVTHADWGIVTQAFLRLFDQADHDIAESVAHIEALIDTLTTLFINGRIFMCATSASAAAGASDIPALGRSLKEVGVSPHFVTHAVEKQLRNNCVLLQGEAYHAVAPH